MIKKDHFTCYFCLEEYNFARDYGQQFYVVHTTIGDVEVCENCLHVTEDWEHTEIEEAKLNW